MPWTVLIDSGMEPQIAVFIAKLACAALPAIKKCDNMLKLVRTKEDHRGVWG